MTPARDDGSSKELMRSLKILARRIRKLETFPFGGQMTITPPSGGHEIMEEGVVLPAEPFLNFIGTGVTAADNPIDGRTDVTIAPGGLVSVLEGPGIDVVTGDTVGIGGDTILLYDSAGNPVAEFNPNSAGLDAASAAATDGDEIRLYSVSISGDHTWTPGVTYTGSSPDVTILTGHITGAEESVTQNLKILVTVNDALDNIGYQGATNDKLDHCVVQMIQQGSGFTLGVRAGAGQLDVNFSDIYGESASGDGYGCGKSDLGGDLYLDHTRCTGSTAQVWE